MDLIGSKIESNSDEVRSLFEQIFFATGFGLCGIFGVIGNPLVIFVIYRDPGLRISDNLSNFLIAQLALTDLMTSAFISIPAALSFLFDTRLVFGYFCNTQASINIMTMCASWHLLGVITIDRFIVWYKTLLNVMHLKLNWILTISAGCHETFALSTNCNQTQVKRCHRICMDIIDLGGVGIRLLETLLGKVELIKFKHKTNESKFIRKILIGCFSVLAWDLWYGLVWSWTQRGFPLDLLLVCCTCRFTNLVYHPNECRNYLRITERQEEGSKWKKKLSFLFQFLLHKTNQTKRSFWSYTAIFNEEARKSDPDQYDDYHAIVSDFVNANRCRQIFRNILSE